MKNMIILLVALATASPVLAQAAPGHSGHGEAPVAAPLADHQGTAPTAPATPVAPAEHAMDCCKEDAAEPCAMPCCARVRQQAGNSDGAATPAPAEGPAHGQMQH